MKYVVLFSGGHASALTAIEAVRKYGKEDVILLNHDLSSKVEHEDIKRFKKEVSDFLGIPITYANAEGFEDLTPLAVCRKAGAFTGNGNRGNTLCTYHLKTLPFHNWLKENYPVVPGEVRGDVCFLYGFEKKEVARIQRRTGVMLSMGYRTDYPLARYERTIFLTEEVGIKKPSTYRVFKHANCIGCLKAGKASWYATFCLRRDIFDEACDVEEELGFSIFPDTYLKELIPLFERMQRQGICPRDNVDPAAFWAEVHRYVPGQLSLFDVPCECSLY